MHLLAPRQPWLGVLDRAFLVELAPSFGLAVTVFTFFLLLERLYDLTEMVITKGVPFHLVLQLLAYLLPALLVHALPMGLLVAVLLTAGRRAADLEVVACKASGISLVRIFRPALLATVAVSLTTGWLTLVLAPSANGAFQNQLFAILQARAVTGLKERVFNTGFGDTVIYVEDISPSQVALRGVLVSDERDPALSRIITAREGRILTDETNRRVTLRLLNGGVNEADVTPIDLRPPARGPAAAAGTAPAGGAASARRYRYTGFRVYDMALALESPAKKAPSDRPEKDLSLAELTLRAEDRMVPLKDRRQAASEWHKRFAYPVAPFAFILLGFPLAVRSHRGGRSVALVVTLLISVTHYLLLGTLEDLAVRRFLPVALAVWTPNVVFGVAGILALVVTAREWRSTALRGLWRLTALLWQRLPRRRPRREERFRAAAPGTTLLIDRYLMRRFLGFVGLGLAVAATLAVLFDLLDTLDRIMKFRPSVFVLIERLGYKVPIMLYHALPIVMLVSTIFLFLTLVRWHELTALKAAGVSLWRTSTPVLAVGAVVALTAGLFQEFLLPILNERGVEVERVKIKGLAPRHLRSRTRLWLRSADTRFFRVELFSPVTNDLHGVTVLEVDRQFRLVNRLDALRAHYSEAGWELSDGALRQIGPEGQITTIPFAQTGMELEETVRDFTDIQKPPGEMSYRELRDYVSRLEAAGFGVRRYLVDMYAKLSEPLRNAIMVLVAIPFALAAPRSGRLYGVALAVVLLAAYTVIDYSARAFARADLLPPLLAAWTANIIFLGVGSSLFLRART
jgi:LPS export ABC transporter permease LptG